MKKQPQPSASKNFIWDEELLIGYTKVNDSTRLSVSLASKADKMYVTLSKLYRTKSDPNFKAAKGFSIPLEKAEQINSFIEKAISEGEKIIVGKQMELDK